ncbi:Leucine-rich repeat receptor-like protein [Vigna angularis]|uniref:Leucine-rich repeat receptor-like protein n=1 Tax=Phaseolus angularis TaxID=3914 RepID=A0A8T0KJE7_PHAAN|nr:Leucine-rich repeat receptor-like protein [Vigna angularis]
MEKVGVVTKPNNEDFLLVTNTLLPLALAFTIFCVVETAWQNDTLALTQFRLQTDTHDNLLSNWTKADACSAAWLGAECSSNDRVVGLSLPSLNLYGPIDSLSPLVYLRFLDLHENLCLLLRLDISDNNI